MEPDIIGMALREDMPAGDLTTDNLGITEKFGRASLLAKEDLIVSGSELFTQTMLRLNPAIQIHWHINDGGQALDGQSVATLSGNLPDIIKAERVALNFLGHLSGIASLTRCYADQVRQTSCKILDTRKTTPGLRRWEKQAVVDGGGFNHRMNLSDAILIKENHIRLAGGMTAAVQSIREKSDKPIEVEVTSLDEVKAAVGLKVDRLLLDNMNLEELNTALRFIPKNIQTEASGNVTLDRVRAIAEQGVDFISIGAITHSAPCADLSLLFDWEKP